MIVVSFVRTNRCPRCKAKLQPFKKDDDRRIIGLSPILRFFEVRFRVCTPCADEMIQRAENHEGIERIL